MNCCDSLKIPISEDFSLKYQTTIRSAADKQPKAAREG
jgi:hypothetical protein